MYSEKEILDALNVLKNMCATTENCKDCPVGDDGHCTIRGYSPADWDIGDENDEK